jgi:diacylglycerol kinase (ATP)
MDQVTGRAHDGRAGDAAAPPAAEVVAPIGARATGRRSPAALAEAIHRDRRAAVVINARSRRGSRHFATSCERLRECGFDLVGTFGARSYDELRHGLAESVRRGPDLLVVGGGDGTLSEAVRHLAHRDVALGVLPLGTTNNFARNLGLPFDPVSAVDVLARGTVIDVDLGQVGEHLFANMVSLGLSSQVAAKVPARLKRLVGRAAYPLTAATRLPAHRPFEARFVVRGVRHQVTTHQLNIANGNFHAGLPISADGTADDQLLMVYPMGGPTRRGLIRATARHALLGRFRPMTAPPFLVTDDLWLETDPALPLDVDGEIVGITPVRVCLAARALRVVVEGPADVPADPPAGTPADAPA